jgi:uncharacterized protein
MINIHTHIFTCQDVPVDFLKDSLKAPDWLKRKAIRMLQAGGWQQGLILKLLKKTGEGKKFEAFVRVGISKSMEEVFELLNENGLYPEGTKFIALPMQFEHMGAGFCEQNSYNDQLNLLLKARKIYPQILPFFAIDPRMASTTLDVAIIVREHMNKALPIRKNEAGQTEFIRAFFGIKLYPSLGFFPYDPLLYKMYEYAAEYNLPIMTHTSRGGVNFQGNRSSLPTINNPQSFKRIDPCLLPYGSDPKNPLKEPKYKYPRISDPSFENKDFCDYFLDPENYVDAIEEFNNLKICFAHFGSDHELAKKLGIDLGDFKYAGQGERSDTWIDKVLSLLKNEKYPNLFTDISYTLVHSEFNKLVKDEIEKDLKINGTSNLDKRLISKVMFGTDFFMAYQEENTTERTLFDKAQADYINIDSNTYPLITSLGDNVLWAYLTEKNPLRYISSKLYDPNANPVYYA